MIETNGKETKFNNIKDMHDLVYELNWTIENTIDFVENNKVGFKNGEEFLDELILMINEIKADRGYNKEDNGGKDMFNEFAKVKDYLYEECFEVYDLCSDGINIECHFESTDNRLTMYVGIYGDKLGFSYGSEKTKFYNSSEEVIKKIEEVYGYFCKIDYLKDKIKENGYERGCMLNLLDSNNRDVLLSKETIKGLQKDYNRLQEDIKDYKDRLDKMLKEKPKC